MSEFSERGFKVFEIPADVVEELKRFFSEQYQRPFDADDCVPSYSKSNLDQHQVAELNQKHQFYGPVGAEVFAPLMKYLRSIAAEIETELGYPWRIGNVRAWKSHPASDFGPTAWHRDGLPKDAIKMMLYLAPMNLENGTVEIVDRTGEEWRLVTDRPACVLFDNNALRHRGRCGKGDRLAIEVLTLPADKTYIGYIYAGQNARAPLQMAQEAAA